MVQRVSHNGTHLYALAVGDDDSTRPIQRLLLEVCRVAQAAKMIARNVPGKALQLVRLRKTLLDSSHTKAELRCRGGEQV
jgi:hypothetical protein